MTLTISPQYLEFRLPSPHLKRIITKQPVTYPNYCGTRDSIPFYSKSPVEILSPTQVSNLQLKVLGFHEKAPLIREDYNISLEILEGQHKNTHAGGVVVTGYPGIGMCSSLSLFMVIKITSTPNHYQLGKILLPFLYPTIPIEQGKIYGFPTLQVIFYPLS